MAVTRPVWIEVEDGDTVVLDGSAGEVYRESGGRA
ncbi:MAG: hypothetical protein ACLTF6_00010 [Clostridium sp.]